MNKKKIFRPIAIALILLLQLGILSACGTEEQSQPLEERILEEENPSEITESYDEQPDYSLYIPVLENAIAERPNDSDEYGLLYDLDQDGVEELFLLHSYPVQTMGYSVYDIEFGAVIPKLEKQDLFMLAGSYKCFAGITDVNGKECFYVYGLQAGNGQSSSKIMVYGSDISLTEMFESNIDAANGNSSNTAFYMVNDSSCTEEEYFNQLNALFPFDTSCFTPGYNNYDTFGMFYDGEWYGTRIEELLQQLKEAQQGGELAFVEEAPESVAPEEASSPIPTDYSSFLQEERYMDIDAVRESINLPDSYLSKSEKSYALLDINQDGIEELIINIKPEPDFMFSLIFTYDAEGQIAFVSNLYHYAYIRYSPEYLAIECSELRPSVYTGDGSFYTLNGTELTMTFSVGWDTYVSEDYNYVYYPDSGQTTTISQDERLGYFSNMQEIEWIPLA